MLGASAIAQRLGKRSPLLADMVSEKSPQVAKFSKPPLWPSFDLGHARGSANDTDQAKADCGHSANVSVGYVEVPPRSAAIEQRAMKVGDQKVPEVFDVAAALITCPFLSSCSRSFYSSLLDGLGELGRKGNGYDIGEVVATEGTPSVSMFIVRHGVLEVTQGPARTRVHLLSAGDFFGQGSLDGTELKHSFTVRSLTMCHVWEVNGIAFTRALLENPADRHRFQADKPAPKPVSPPPPQQTSSFPSSPSKWSISQQQSPSPLLTPTRWKPKELQHLQPHEHLHSRTVGKRGSDIQSSDRQVLQQQQSPQATYLLTQTYLPKEASRGKDMKAESEAMTNIVEMMSKAKQPLSPVKTMRRSIINDVSVAPPVWWRKLNSNDLRPTTAEDEALIEHMKDSLRADLRSGCLLPGMTGETSSPFGSPRRSPRGDAAADSISARGAGPAASGDRGETLDIELLPPIGVMSPLQKKAVQRQLELRVEAKQKLRRAARRQVLLSRCFHNSG